MASLNVIRSCTISSLTTIFHQNVCRSILRSSFLSGIGTLHHKSSDVDALDIFTTGMLSKAISAPTKSNVIESSSTADRKVKSNISSTNASQSETNDTCDQNMSLDMSEWSQTDIDTYLTACINYDDRITFKKIVENILETKSLPSDPIILRILSYLCDDRDDSMTIISRLIDLCEQKNMAFYARNVEFIPYLSQHLWKAERFDDALKSLASIFATTNKTAKEQILRNYRQIIFDTVKNQDELILEKVIVNAKQIYTLNKNPILIICIWSDCFFSGLFRNQKRADELFDTFDEVRRDVANNIGWIVLTMLKQHNIDAIHRLIEKCLAFDMKREVGVCLTALFDYHYWRDDLRSCSEVMSTSLRLGTTVSNSQNQKLVNLLLNKKPKSKPQSTTKPAAI